MTRFSLLLALSALAALAFRPVDLHINLDGLADDAPAWLDQLVERAD